MSKNILEGQNALVTGAGRGIGRAIAQHLAEQGAHVYLVARSQEQLDSAVQEIQQAGHQATAWAADLSDPQQAEKVAADFAATGPSILVNNAGMTRDNVLLRMKDEHWDEVLNLNLRAAFLLTRTVSKSMLKARYGRIINITSVIGIRGNAGQSNYAASKAGLIGFTRSLARELGARNITVNAVAPGYIETDMTDSLPDKVKEGILGQVPLGRMGLPKDIARAVGFLAHPESDYITGQVLNVDGGML
ncbi:MAG: 3-oxoacyl-[acyl-carrier-protein] reductase [Vulcanimicrobiota bacterium]